MITIGTLPRYRDRVVRVTSKKFRAAHGYVIAGIVAITVLTAVVSTRVGAISAGVALTILAWVRYRAPDPVAIAARSPRFDSLMLAVLGVGTLILGITADNI